MARTLQPCGTPTRGQQQSVAEARRMAVLEALAGFDSYPTGRRGAA